MSRIKFVDLLTEEEAVQNDRKDKLYRIWATDENGRHTGCIGVFRAQSESKAREVAAKHVGNDEIASTGFYRVELVTKEQLTKEIMQNRKEIELRTTVINPRKGPSQGDSYRPGSGWGEPVSNTYGSHGW